MSPLCLCTVINYLCSKPLPPQKPTLPEPSCLLRIVEACSPKKGFCRPKPHLRHLRLRIEATQPFIPEEKATTLQCARHRAVVVSYVAMQDRTILCNAAIDGSVYGCIAENYHYAAAPCCQDASQLCSLKCSVKKMRIVIMSSRVIVICAKEVHVHGYQPALWYSPSPASK